MIDKQMNIKEILKAKLCKESASGKKRNIIFWYDADKEFENEIENLVFDNTKVVTLADNNAFALKYDIEVADLESNYLLYAPFGKPEDRENWLLDIQKYSEEFTTERAVYEMRRLGITDEALKPVIKSNMKFFANEKRVKKLESFGITEYDSKSLEIGIISVLAKLKVADFDELIKILLREDLEGRDNLIKNIVKYGNLDSFYSHIKQRFGCTDNVFKVDAFAAMLFFTAFSYEYEGKLPFDLDRLKSSKMSEVVVFVSEFIKDENYFEAAEKYSRKFEEILRIKKVLDEVSTENFVKCETFKIIDEIIIERMIKNIIDGNKDFDTHIHNAKVRRTSLWKNSFINEYRALINGLELLQKFDSLSGKFISESLNDFYTMYITEFSQIDYYYRKFYYHYDQIDNKDALSELNQVIENTYVTGYLDTLSIKWSSLIEEEGLSMLDSVLYKKQWDFYSDYVKKYSNNDERIFVIISDAMRYEVALELTSELLKERRAEISLSAMQGVIPSQTKFGMAALLPRTVMTYDEDQCIRIDGIKTSGIKNREKVLLQVNVNSLAIKYDDIKNMKNDEYKAAFAGKKLVYIYHDTIDRIGHAGTPFDAAEAAISEIKDTVRSLVNRMSAAKIIITADHGFIYQRSNLAEYDKMKKAKNDLVIETDRRYIISTETTDDMNLLNLPLSQSFQTVGSLQVIVPKRSIRFKTQGSDGNFVHGGATLQEMVVPVIEYFDKRSDVYKAKKVEVELTSITRKLTNRITHLEFFQTKSVSEKKLPLNVKIFLADSNGKRVSNEVMIIADSNSSVPENRTFKGKFVLRNLGYKKEDTYYLVFEDDEENINPIIKKIPFYIDLAIGDDFGF
ncbi:MAG: BREX-1 system phosphatase PglZ type A [Clostridiales bacterium]|nr:BREX-1 system phosphatase PglZ type A [Clostridiales bacterium]